MTIEFPIETPVTNVVRFVNCCTGQEIFFRGSLPYMNGIVVTYLGELPFAGSGGSLEPTSDEFGACYTFYSEYQDEVPGYPSIAPVSNLFSPIVDGCQDPKCFCPGQSSNCYMVIPCDGTDPAVTSNQAFEPYVNSFITVNSSGYNGCAYVVPLSYTDCLTGSVPGNICASVTYQYQRTGAIIQFTTELVTTPFIYTGQPVYLIEDPSFPLPLYLVYTGANWQVWSGFDPITGPFCDLVGPYACCEQSPGIFLPFFQSDDLLNTNWTNLCIPLPAPGSQVESTFILQTTYCLDPSTLVPVDESCECDLNCYYVANTNGFFYVDSNDVLQNVSPVNAQPYIKVCSKIPPVAESGSVSPQIINLGPCEEDECPIQCFKLVNCQNPDLVIYTTSNSLLPYVYGPNKIVNVLGKEGCWTASELDEGEECDCPIDITVTSSFVTCSDCIGIKAYKLISCEGNSTIYTYLNLEAYINQIVKLDCGCYKVEEINYAPPNPQVVKLEDIYPNCTACLRTHWKLTDCTNPDNSVITYTDLSLYTNNVIKIEGCTECWLVESTEDYLNAVEVVVTDDYEDCEECGIPTVCNCTKVTNLNEVSKVYSYFDCDNVFQEILLQPGESSEKVCATRWLAESPYCQCIKFTQNDFDAYAVLIPNTLNLEKPVYRLCVDAGCIFVYWNGQNWVIGEQIGSSTVLFTLEGSTSNFCPYGTWTENSDSGSSTPTPNPAESVLSLGVISLECNIEACKCVNVTVADPKGLETFQLNLWAIDQNGFPVYSNDGIVFLSYSEECEDCPNGCWSLSEDLYPFVLCSSNSSCPTGSWVFSIIATSVDITECPVEPVEFTVYDHFETFGECKFGTCPPPVFKNNRTVKPGYNTPNCNPEEYDKITCRFADVMYKLVLEKRYGISNCCPDEDEKWLMKKELIDLQALKSPDYTAPILAPTPVPVVIPKPVIPPAPCPVPPAPPVPAPCNECIKVRFIPITPSGLGNAVTLYISSSGVYPNGTHYYNFNYEGTNYKIYNETYNTTGADPGGWYLYTYDDTDDIGYNSTVGTCPTGTFVMSESGYFNNFTVSLCGTEKTDYVLYSVLIDGQGNSSFFTYPDCADQARTENFPPSRSSFSVLVCSKPGQTSQFVGSAVTFIVTETTTTCNCGN